MKIYKITEASKYLGISINSLKTLANNGKLNSFKTSGEHRRFREDDLDAYMGVKKEKQERLTVIYARCSTAKQKENLERQKDRLRKHAEEKGYKYLMIDEIASGINEKRNGIHKKASLRNEWNLALLRYAEKVGTEDAPESRRKIVTDISQAIATAVSNREKEIAEEVEEIQTKLHNGHLEAGYKLTNKLLSILKH